MVFNDYELQLPLCDVGQFYTLVRFESIDSSYLAYLSDQGFAISTKIKIIKRFEFDHSLLIDINGNHLQLSLNVANQIYVTPISS